MSRVGEKPYKHPNLMSPFSSSFTMVACVVCVTLGGTALRSLAEGVDEPDYFSSTRKDREAPPPGETGQGLTQADALAVLSRADAALQKLASGDPSAAWSFASLFGARVDYYDEGLKTPEQIAQDKMEIFRKYRSYSTEQLGNPMMINTDSPDTKWVSFTYRYTIVKKAGGTLRGVAEARWALRKVGGKAVVIATKETTYRR